MREDLNEVFMSVLEVDTVSENDSVHTVESWDSVRHLSLIMALEERFEIAFDTAEIATLTSYKAILEALQRRLQAA